MNDANDKNLNDAETRQLLHALYAPGTEQEGHDLYADRIAEMVDRTLAGDDLNRQEPDFMPHIATCTLCGPEFANLVAVQRAEAAGQLPTQPAPAGLRLRASAQEQMEIPQLLFPLREEGARVRLVPGAASDEQGMILVQIDDLADGAPRPQVRVSLLDDNAHPLERLYTDTDGAVIFKELMTGHYIIQIDLGRGYNCPFHIA